MFVVVGDGVVWVGGSGVGGGCGGSVSPVPGVGDGGEFDVDCCVEDGGGLVAGVGVGVDDEGFGDDDFWAGWLAGDARALCDECGGLAGGDRDRAGVAAGGFLGSGGLEQPVVHAVNLRVFVAVVGAFLVGFLVPHRRF